MEKEEEEEERGVVWRALRRDGVNEEENMLRNTQEAFLNALFQQTFC